jgi:acetylornithine deacetylase/succinyl-diaminopimelate desuccinylase family protein
MIRELNAHLASKRDEMLQFLRSLISIPTENPPGNAYPECMAALRSKLRGLGLKHEVHGQCIQAHSGSGKRTLYFHGHYDVVPASDRAQFNPLLKGANLFGRGSSDMKSGLVAMIYAVDAIRKCGIALDGRIALTLVPDEETGGRRGSQFLVKSGLLGKNGVGMLTPEPTSGVVWNASRGAITMRVILRGKAAHVGLQHAGRNAFDSMVRVAQRLGELKADVESRKTEFRISPEAARRSILMMGGQCGGGTNFNLVPADAWFTVERRINPEEDLKTEKARLLKFFVDLKRDGVDLETEIIQEGQSCGVSQEHPLARALAEGIRKVTGKTARFQMCPGLLEIRFYAERGMPAFAYGPGLLSVSHGPHEFVPVQNIHECALVYAMTAVKFLGPAKPT